MTSKRNKLPLHYWDSCNFISILKNDPAHYQGCFDVLNEASEGRLLIVTSSITLAAIVKIAENSQKKSPALINSEESEKIRKFFQHEYFVFLDFDRKTAEISRNISMEFGIKAFDAMHIASAIRAKVDFFETSDGDLINKMDKNVGDPLIKFQKACIPSKQLGLNINFVDASNL
jgi:predicted nucleic acid-binding protein